VGEGVKSCPRAGCGKSACPVRWAGCGNGATARLLGHRQTKRAGTDKPDLLPPRHISTLPWGGVTDIQSTGSCTLHTGTWGSAADAPPRLARQAMERAAVEGRGTAPSCRLHRLPAQARNLRTRPSGRCAFGQPPWATRLSV